MMSEQEMYSRFCADVEMVHVEYYDPGTGYTKVNEGMWVLQRDYWNDLNSMVPIVEKLLRGDGQIIKFKSSRLPMSIKHDFRNFILEKMHDLHRD